MKKSILKAVHESAKDLHQAEVMSAQTMREFDALCLPRKNNKKGRGRPKVHH